MSTPPRSDAAPIPPSTYEPEGDVVTQHKIGSFADMPAEADAAEREWKATQTVERYAAVLRYLADNATPEARLVLLGALDVCERGELLPPGDGTT